MKSKLKIVFRIFVVLSLVCFYVFRYVTGTIPIGIPLRIRVINVEIKSGQITGNQYPVVLSYDNGINTVDGTCANLLLSEDNIGKKTIIELQVKSLSGEGVNRWVYGIFNN